ncbi:hypothetical protein SS50377_22745 [Spironucleus salmonicida]|uniref:Uncharacterized protein n=1 Tax=Spironucleus salmonicida TaxID=348837 RepID=A0A9P8RZX5_9EUKA|nr:hypothetical protein SS50377_22745 [Spironucleus salmonicida]
MHIPNKMQINQGYQKADGVQGDGDKPVQPFLPVRAEPKYTVPKTFNFTMFKSPCK